MLIIHIKIERKYFLTRSRAYALGASRLARDNDVFFTHVTKNLLLLLVINKNILQDTWVAISLRMF